MESEDNNLSSLSLSLIESLIFVLAGDVEASIVLNFGLFDVVLSTSWNTLSLGYISASHQIIT